MMGSSTSSGPAGTGDRYYGVAFAIVTNNPDPEGLARVKVAFPGWATRPRATGRGW